MIIDFRKTALKTLGVKIRTDRFEVGAFFASRVPRQLSAYHVNLSALPNTTGFKIVWCVRETEILAEQQLPQGVFVCDHAGLVINQFFFRGRRTDRFEVGAFFAGSRLST